MYGYGSQPNYYQQSIINENRAAMITSYFALHQPREYFGDNYDTYTQKQFPELKYDKILKNINYDDVESLKTGLRKLYMYSEETDQYYLSLGKDPDKVSECNNIIKKCQEISKLINAVKSNREQ